MFEGGGGEARRPPIQHPPQRHILCQFGGSKDSEGGIGWRDELGQGLRR